MIGESWPVNLLASSLQKWCINALRVGHVCVLPYDESQLFARVCNVVLFLFVDSNLEVNSNSRTLHF